jgi:ATP-dependent exoDNAse (exonuclease V) alpha subunit
LVAEFVATGRDARLDMEGTWVFAINMTFLCPMNRGGVGARSLNIELQAALNPAGERKVERFGWIEAA